MGNISVIWFLSTNINGLFNQNVSLIVKSSPTDIILSKGLTFDSLTAIDENIESSSTIGKLFTLDATPGDTFTYSLQLVEGDGDSDNSSFALDGNQLKILESPDFESQEVYSLNIRTTDSEGFSFEKSLTLKVNDLVEVEPRSQDAAISKYETAYKGDTKPGKEVFDKFKFKDNILYHFLLNLKPIVREQAQDIK